MTVQEVFALRKEGKVEEAWQAIQPMYADHQGHYTTLAFFWTANDVLKRCVAAGDSSQARRLLYQMTTAYPSINDQDGTANAAVALAAMRLDRMVEKFNLAYFMPYFQRLKADDWKAQKVDDHWVPALGQRVVLRLFRHYEELKGQQEIDAVMDFFKKAMRQNPNDRNNLRIWARLHLEAGRKDEAIRAYRSIINRYKDPSSCRALSRLVDDPAEKIALLCKGINDQPQEKFRSRMRVELARMLMSRRPSLALYELQRSRQTRQAAGHHVPDYALLLEQRLKGTVPASAVDERDFFVRAISYLKRSQTAKNDK